MTGRMAGKRSFALKVSFDWRDVWQQEHAHAFTVAKAARADILADIHEAVDNAIREGTTLHQFRKQLTPLLQKKGWWGKRTIHRRRRNR